MFENLKHTSQFLMRPLWRRKYLLISGCILCTIVYVLLHYSSSPDSSESISGKHPLETKLIASEKDIRAQALPQKTPSQRSLTQNSRITQESSSNPISELKSVREKYAAQGIQPTSFTIKLKTKNRSRPTPKEAAFYTPTLRVIHLDFKGAPPKLSYFKSIFPLLKQAGANALLVEYEDTFPYWGPLSVVTARNAYTTSEIRSILQLAQHLELQVIPLVQTFGHLEFILKLAEFKHLREVPDQPQSVCPTNNSTLLLVQMLIDQVAALHPDARWLHIGLDEVWQLGRCSRCARYERTSLFLAYARKVARYVRQRHRLVPIVWDDMLRGASASELARYQMGELVEPMAWAYAEDVDAFLPAALWDKYGAVFPAVWAASAFKGAFGETATVPDARRHLENNRAWLRIMAATMANGTRFRGLALTGWSRYDHFAALCELLPAALPSLTFSLLAVLRPDPPAALLPQARQLLACPESGPRLDLASDPFLWRALGGCFFPGSPVFRLTLRHADLARSLDRWLREVGERRGWMTEWHARHNFSSPLRVAELLQGARAHNASLAALAEAAARALRQVYDDATVAEWIELHVEPRARALARLAERGRRLSAHSTWPRRPLPALVALPPADKEPLV